jgi:hypothetical protein
MNLSPEKRTSPRTALHQVVRFERTATAAGLPGSELTQGVGRDISREGASFLTDCPLRPGEVLRLHIPLEAERASVPVLSEVRWTEPTRNGFRVGLQFLA